MQWFAQAPANIALIKYMGKQDGETNLPANPSLSYTLNNLITNVMLEQCAGKKDYWEPLTIPGGPFFTLSLAAQQRYLNHLQRLKNYFNYSGAFIVRSSNNFPTSSGLASSASSFAALTRCAVRALCELTEQPLLSEGTQAMLSRLGSGSSCRSFFSPWALWEEDKVSVVNLPYSQLLHQVIVISHEEKHISSSEAHQRVKTSSHYSTRSQRARNNLKLLLRALEARDWFNCYQICWHEFQDMHHLFSTCEKPFKYITPQAEEVLQQCQTVWQEEKDGPLITMDAGPNIHLLYRTDQANLAQHFKQQYLIGNYDIL